VGSGGGFAEIENLREVLLLIVCGSMADCDDDENITARSAAHLHFL